MTRKRWLLAAALVATLATSCQCPTATPEPSDADFTVVVIGKSVVVTGALSISTLPADAGGLVSMYVDCDRLDAMVLMMPRTARLPPVICLRRTNMAFAIATVRPASKKLLCSFVHDQPTVASGQPHWIRLSLMLCRMCMM